MSRATALAFACLACFLVLLPLSLKKPGLPMRLSGEEATYFSMAASLAADGDLHCDRADLDRLFAEFPFAGQLRLDLDRDDDGTTARFDRPLLYPLLAAPLVALWGANGAVALNGIFFLLALAFAWHRLRRISNDGVALLFGFGFFFFSTASVYLFRIQPQVMVMAMVTIAMALGWKDREAEECSDAEDLPNVRRWWLSGAALGVAILQQTVLVVLAVPLLAGFLRRHRRTCASWLAGCGVTLVLGTLLSIAWTGNAWPDHLRRTGPATTITLSNPQQDPMGGSGDAIGQAEAAGTRRATMDLLEDASFFLWGRRTGILPYFPFIIPILVLFAVSGRRRRGGWRGPEGVQTWALLATLAFLGILQVIFEPASRAFHEAQIGNPHMVGIYPAFLFLIKRLRPAMIVAGFGLGALVLGPLVSSSLGVVVPKAGIHSHTRNLPFRMLPLEYPALGRLSGFGRLELYGVDGTSSPRPEEDPSARLWAPSDQAEARGEELWLLGGESVELWLESRTLLPSAVFSLHNLASGNRISMRMAGEEIERQLDQVPEQGLTFRLEFDPEGADKVRRDDQGLIYYYRLRLDTRLGEKPKWRQHAATRDYLGVALGFLGTRKFLEHDLYAMEWLACGAPPRVAPEEKFLAAARLRNLSDHRWPDRGPARVRLSYRWLDAGGDELPHASLRTELPNAVDPGREIASWISIDAPRAPGKYFLELDPLFENVAWFSSRGPAATCRAAVEVSD